MLLSPNIKMVLGLVQYLTKIIPQNMWFFWSNPYKTEIMLTSLKLWSHDHICNMICHVIKFCW